jgi:hypothetical protein
MGGDSRARRGRPLILPLLLALAAPAAAAETPAGFVSRLYASYRDENFSPFRRKSRIFAPAFVAALDEDSRLYRDEVGFIDADPICQCQDPAGMKAEVGRARTAGAGRAEVPVRIRFGASDVRDIRLELIRVGGAWRIADIASADEPSFLAELQASNRRRRAELRR